MSRSALQIYVGKGIVEASNMDTTESISLFTFS